MSENTVNQSPVISAMLREQARQLAEFVTRPDFLDAVESVRAETPERRLKAASENFSPSALEAKGLVPPIGTRITSRYFEESTSTLVSGIELGDGSTQRRQTPSGDSLIDELGKASPALLLALAQKSPNAIDDLRRSDSDGSADLRIRNIKICCGVGPVTVGVDIEP